MKRYIKRSVSLLLIIAVFISCMPIANAVNLGTLSYWYANYNSQNQIGRWASNAISISATKLNSNTSFQFQSGISHAVEQWKDEINRVMTISTTSSTGNIKWYGGTIAQIAASTGFTLSNDVAGYTAYSSIAVEGTWTYGSSTKTGYIFSAITCYTRDNSYTANMYKNISTHELGHALGWMDHTATTLDVMYHTASEITTLTIRDKNHLKQVY